MQVLFRKQVIDSLQINPHPDKAIGLLLILSKSIISDEFQMVLRSSFTFQYASMNNAENAFIFHPWVKKADLLIHFGIGT